MDIPLQINFSVMSLVTALLAGTFYQSIAPVLDWEATQALQHQKQMQWSNSECPCYSKFDMI